MKKLLSVLLTLSMMPTYAGSLKSFNDIYNSIQAGKTIRMIINFDYCSPKPHVANLNVYTAPTAIMMRKNYLQFANSPLTTNNPLFPKKPILENCTYKIKDNNEVQLTTRIITLPEYTVVSEVNSVCPLGTAVKVFN